jgi:hypothetical protein
VEAASHHGSKRCLNGLDDPLVLTILEFSQCPDFEYLASA